MTLTVPVALAVLLVQLGVVCVSVCVIYTRSRASPLFWVIFRPLRLTWGRVGPPVEDPTLPFQIVLALLLVWTVYFLRRAVPGRRFLWLGEHSLVVG